jgi:hypothetical protein
MTLTPPLLSMMSATTKVRPRRAHVSAPKEIVLHFGVAKLLREHCLQEWRWFHVPNGEKRDMRTATKLKQMGVQRGVADFILFSPFDNRQIHFLELKRLGEGLNEDQEDWREWALSHGAKYEVAWTMEQVLLAFERWGCLRVEFMAKPGYQRRAAE